jgi:hypothetical protein
MRRQPEKPDRLAGPHGVEFVVADDQAGRGPQQKDQTGDLRRALLPELERLPPPHPCGAISTPALVRGAQPICEFTFYLMATHNGIP